MKNIKLSKIFLNVINEAVAVTGISDEEMDNDVEKMIDYLDFPVTTSGLKSAYDILLKYANSDKGKEFLELYDASGLAASSLKTSLNWIYTTKPQSVRIKKQMLQLIDAIESGKGVTSSDKEPVISGELSDDDLKKINFQFGGGGGTTTGPVEDPIKRQGEPKYRECPDVKDNIPYGCRNEMIKDIQICKGIEPSLGYFGPKTRRSLGVSVITKDMYDTIMANCRKTPTIDNPEVPEYLKRSMMDKFKKDLEAKGIGNFKPGPIKIPDILNPNTSNSDELSPDTPL
jgi:hypothetical protein